MLVSIRQLQLLLSITVVILGQDNEVSHRAAGCHGPQGGPDPYDDILQYSLPSGKLRSFHLHHRHEH